MAKQREKQKALKLRKLGKSYSQIKKVLRISKSTLSSWLKNYPLPPEKIRELRDWNHIRIEHYRETRSKTREALLKQIYDEEKEKILPFSDRDIFFSGLFLYLGEGGKTKPFELSLSNTDPALIKFFIYWLTKNLGAPKKKLKIKLHLYRDMNIKKEISFWSKILHISKSQFKKPYVKESFLSSLTIRAVLVMGRAML